VGCAVAAVFLVCWRRVMQHVAQETSSPSQSTSLSGWPNKRFGVMSGELPLRFVTTHGQTLPIYGRPVVSSEQGWVHGATDRQIHGPPAIAPNSAS
jgi:hypothetical protein